MTGRIFCYLLSYLLIWGAICSEDHSENDAPNFERNTRVKVNIPNFFNLMPNLGRLLDDFDKDVINSAANPPKEDGRKQAAPPHIHEVKDNYKTLREFVQSALNLGRRGLNSADIFSLNLGNNGPNRKLDLNSLFGRLSMNAKTTDPAKTDESSAETEEPSTEVPLNEYINSLIKEQSKGVNDFLLSIFGPNSGRIASADSTDKKTSVDVSSPVLPVKVSIDSRSGVIERYDDLIPDSTTLMDDQTGSGEATLDPEVEYLKHAERLHRNQLLMRGHNPDAGYFDGDEQPMRRPISPLLDMLRSDFKRKATKGKPKHRDPVKEMTEYYYNLSTGKSKESPGENAYEEYIEDIEKITGSLEEDSRKKLQKALKQFRNSIEKIDFGENIDVSQLIDEPEDSHAWVPRKEIDQRDLEIAFLNINENEKPNPGDQMVIAFTPSGTPLKIFMDSDVENPVLYLHKRLTEAGISLHIPVASFRDMETVGGEVLLVGGVDNLKLPTRAMSIIIPKADRIPSYVRRFTKAANRFPSGMGRNPKELAQALQEYLSFDKDLLQFEDEEFKVLADVINRFQKTSIMTQKPALEEFFEKTRNP